MKQLFSWINFPFPKVRHRIPQRACQRKITRLRPKGPLRLWHSCRNQQNGHTAGDHKEHKKLKDLLEW